MNARQVLSKGEPGTRGFKNDALLPDSSNKRKTDDTEIQARKEEALKKAAMLHSLKFGNLKDFSSSSGIGIEQL